MTGASRHVLVITQDPLGAEMGGNAIRAGELARVLAAHAGVTLAAPGSRPDFTEGLRHVPFDPDAPSELRHAIESADVVVAPPQNPVVSAWLRRARARLVFDLYDPTPLELLEAYAGQSPLRRRLWQTVALDHLLEALHSGNHFLCASERQRDLWIGALLASRLVTPAAHARDPSFRSVIDVAPFGVPERPPSPGPGARARFPGIAADDELVLWNGGLWSWLDPETAVRAMGRLGPRRPRARLVFMGRPPPDPRQAAASVAARAAAQELGLLGSTVFFNDSWVPYGERDGWLLEADCALSTHRDNLETRYSFRTRLLDCFWAGLPMVCTAGDELGELVERDELGAAVAPGDLDAVAGGLERVLERGRDHFAPRLADAAARFAWPRVAEPLVRFATAEEAPTRLGRPAAQPARRLRSGAVRLLRSISTIVR